MAMNIVSGKRFERSANFARLAADLETLADALADIPIEELRPYRAAAEYRQVSSERALLRRARGELSALECAARPRCKPQARTIAPQRKKGRRQADGPSLGRKRPRRAAGTSEGTIPRCTNMLPRRTKRKADVEFHAPAVHNPATRLFGR